MFPLPSSTGQRHILIVDDDELSREVLELLLNSEGYYVESAASGDELLNRLITTKAPLPQTILTDLQMPGLVGNALADRLRFLCGPAVRLLAMSGSEVPAASIDHYDQFLLKPFSMPELHAALDPKTPTPQPAMPCQDRILDSAIHARLSISMSARQLVEMYTLCLDDTARRLEHMRLAHAASDLETWRKQAHMIKGGCGILGATELRDVAASMEIADFESYSSIQPEVLLDQLQAAHQRLQRMLERQQSQP